MCFSKVSISLCTKFGPFFWGSTLLMLDWLLDAFPFLLHWAIVNNGNTELRFFFSSLFVCLSSNWVLKHTHTYISIGNAQVGFPHFRSIISLNLILHLIWIMMVTYWKLSFDRICYNNFLESTRHMNFYSDYEK